MHDFHTAKFSHVAKYTKKVVMVILWSILTVSTRQVTMGSNILFVNLGMLVTDMIGVI